MSAYIRIGCPLPSSLVYNVLHGEYLGDDNDDNTETSHTVLVVQLLDFHTKTRTYTKDKFNCMV